MYRGTVTGMDKVIFFFHRKDGLSREEFFDHYLNVHAPLGMRLTITMDGYTVNLTDVVDDPDAPDAITEVWTAAAADFMDAGKSFATPAAAQELMTDHDSFIGPYDAYLVEEHVALAADDVGVMGERSPGVKRVSLHGPGDAPLAPVDGALEVVEHRVLRAVTPGAPEVERIVSVRAPSRDAFADDGARACYVSEYRQKLS